MDEFEREQTRDGDMDIRPTPEVGPGHDEEALPSGYDAQKAALKPDGLGAPSDPVLASAVAWAVSERLAPEMISQLQAKVGLAPTGVYDEKTAAGIQAWQKANGRKADGRAGLSTAAALGIIFHRVGKEGTVDQATWEQIKAVHSSGITVVGAVKYASVDKAKDANNQEFINEANEMAPAYQSVAIKGGRIAMGEWFPITSVGDIPTVVNAIHGSLVSAWRTYDKPASDAAPPAPTMVKNLALLSHGVTTGMSLDAGGSYSKGLVGQGGSGTRNLDSFVQSIKGSLAADVNVQLFACNTARDRGTKEGYEDWVSHGDVRGAQSFAQDLADAMAKNGRDDASVFGHTTRGHLRRNDAARGFGKVARESGMVEGEKGGVHAYDLLFPPAVIDAEVTRIYGPVQGAARDKATAVVRAESWKYYRKTWQDKDDAKGSLEDEGVSGSGLGALAFLDLAGARDVVVPHDFAQWVQKNSGVFAGGGALTPQALAGTPRDGSAPLPRVEPKPKPVVVVEPGPTREEKPSEPTRGDLEEVKKVVDPILTPEVQAESRGDVIAAAETIAAKHPTYGTGKGQYVCTTYCEKVLRDAGYTIDKTASAQINIRGEVVPNKPLADLIESDDASIKGIVNALVSSKQGLEVPVNLSAPAEHLRPGDFVQYWRESGGGHCVMVHAVVDKKTIVMLGSHSSTGGVADKTIDLSKGMKRVYGARPMGSQDFAALVALRQSMGLSTEPFGAGGVKVVPGAKTSEPTTTDTGDRSESTKTGPGKVDPGTPGPTTLTPSTPRSDKTHAQREAELASRNTTAIDAQAGMSEEQRASRAQWDEELKAYRESLKSGGDAHEARRRAPLETLASASQGRQRDRTQSDEEAVKSEAFKALDDKKLVIGREKKRARLTERLTHLGLLGGDGEAVTLSAAERASILERVDRLANKLYFGAAEGLSERGCPTGFGAGDESLDEAALDAMTVDLATRVLSGRLLQRFLGDLEAYWSHFTVDKLSKEDKRALKAGDSEAYAEYRADRKLTRDNERRHGKVAEFGRDIKAFFGGKPKDPGPSPSAIEALVATGREGSKALEPHIAALAARAGGSEDTSGAEVAVGARVDQIKDRSSLDNAIAAPLARLGLAALPVSAEGAPQVEGPGANEVVTPGALEAAEVAPPETRPDAFLTVVYKRLAELVLGIHAKPSSESPRLDDVRPGDRVPVTATRQTEGGHVWAQALVQPTHAEAPPGQRLGWIDTAFTNETRASADDTKTESEALTGKVPKGLRVIDYLRPAVAGVPVEVFAGVYPEDRVRPIATLGNKPLELIAQTADNDPELVEVLVDGRPGYVARGSLRKAERAERLLALPSLSASEIAEVRKFATAVGDEAERAAIMERLQAQPLFAAASVGTVPEAMRSGPLAALGMALESLGLPIPYANATSYADALEMVRLERGLPADLAGPGLAKLVGPFGASAAVIDPGALATTMAAGRAVLLVSGASVVRLAARHEDAGKTTWLADDPTRGRVQVDPSAGTLWALSVPAGYDDGTVAKADAGLRDAKSVTDAYKKNVYGATDVTLQAWYLGQASDTHGKDVAESLTGWLPSGREAIAMPAAAQQKAFAGWLAKHGGKGTLDGLAAVRIGFVAPLEAAGVDVANMSSELATRARAIVRRSMEQRPSAEAYDAARRLIDKALALGLLDGAEIAGLRAEAEKLRPEPEKQEPSDADFADLWKNEAPAPGPIPVQKGSEPTPLPSGKGALNGLQLGSGKLTSYVRNKQKIDPAAAGPAQAGDKATVVSGNFSITFSFVAEHGGWVCYGGSSSTIDGKVFDRMVSVSVLEAAGLSRDEATIASTRALDSQGAEMNGWDNEFASFGHNQVTIAAGRMQSALGPALYDEQGRARPAMADLIAALAGVGTSLTLVGDKFRLTVNDADLGACQPGQSLSLADIKLLHAKGRLSFKKGNTAEDELARFKGKVDERAGLAIRTDLVRLGVISGVFSDSRVQIALAISYKEKAIDEIRGTAVVKGGATLGEFPLSVGLLGAFSQACNSSTSAGRSEVRRAFADVAGKNSTLPGVDYAKVTQPSAWVGAAAAAYDEALVASVTGKSAHKRARTFLSEWLPNAEKTLGKGYGDHVFSGSKGTIDYEKAGTLGQGSKGGGAPTQVQSTTPSTGTSTRSAPTFDPSPYMSLFSDATRTARLDAVYASEAGRNNLDRYLAPLQAQLVATGSALAREAAASPRFSQRVLGLLAAASQRSDSNLARAIAKAIDVAEAVASKYPELGKTRVDDPKVVPPKNDTNKVQTGGGASLDLAVAYNQGEWFGAGGKKLTPDEIEVVYAAVATVDKGILERDTSGKVKCVNYNDLSMALDDFLQLAPADRAKMPKVPGQEGWIYISADKKQKIPATAAIMAAPQIKYFPGSKSCQRSARASLHDFGLEIDGRALTFVDEDAEELTGAKSGKRDATRITKVRLDRLKTAYTLLESDIERHPVLIGINYVEYTSVVKNQDHVTDHFMTAIDKTSAGIGYVDPGNGSKGRMKKEPFEITVLESGKEPVVQKLPMWIDPGYKGVGAQLTQVFKTKVEDQALFDKMVGGSGGGGSTPSKTTNSGGGGSTPTRTTNAGGGGGSGGGNIAPKNDIPLVSNDAALDALMKKERLTVEEIAQARVAIERLPTARQAEYFTRLQEKNAYKSQRDNKSHSRRAGSKESTATINNMCNLTSLAMCLEQLGVANPRTLDGVDYPQFEDYLEALRIKDNIGKRTTTGTFAKLAARFGVTHADLGVSGKMPRASWQATVGTALAAGRSVMMSITGHIVRVQAVTPQGLVVDDPYGVIDLNVPHDDLSWSYKSANRNSGAETTSEGKKGEDNLWVWSEVEKHSMNWAWAFGK